MNRTTQGPGSLAFGRSRTWVLALASVGLSVHACQVDKGKYSFEGGGVGGSAGLGAASGLAGEGADPAGDGGRAGGEDGSSGDSSSGSPSGGAGGDGDIDECATDNGGCDPLVECINTPGGFSCGDCPLGFEASPKGACIDIDECATDNGGCDESVVCNNTDGGFTCGDCPAGYSGGGDTGCVDIDECATNNGGCHASADCMNLEGSRRCTCQEGYTGSGTNCTCAGTTPECVNSTTQRSCVDNTLTQTTCTGPSPLCVAGQGCQSCSTLRCGTTCCAAPPENAVSICSPADTCSAQCKSGYHSCGDTQSPCYADNDPASCGSDCVDCTQPNAIAVCDSGECANTCKGSALGCLISPGKTACGSWSFESKGTENFEIVTSTTTASTGLFKAVDRYATDGDYSLAIGYNSSNGSGIIDVNIPLCPGGQGLDLSNQVLKVDIYPETASDSEPYPENRSGNYLVMYNGSEYVYGGCDAYPATPSDEPSVWECTNSTSALISNIVLRFRVLEEWKGTIYIDNVRLE